MNIHVAKEIEWFPLKEKTTILLTKEHRYIENIPASPVHILTKMYMATNP
jgi:hypothetical protein